MAEKFLKPGKEKTKLAMPALSREEIRASTEQRVLGYLAKYHRGQVVPEKYQKALLKDAVNIDAEAKENAEKRFAYAEEKGVLPKKGEKIKIWQNEYLKAIEKRLVALLKGDAEKRVDRVLSSLGEKDKAGMEKNREKYVLFMQYYLARNPNFLFESEAKESTAKVVERVLSSLKGKDREDFEKMKGKLAMHLEKYFLENPRRLADKEAEVVPKSQTAELDKLREEVAKLSEKIAKLEKAAGKK